MSAKKAKKPSKNDVKSADSTLHIALLQLDSMDIKSQKLKTYLSACKKQSIDIVALGEYILNPFFKILESTQSLKADIAKQSTKMLTTLEAYSAKYKLDIIAPLLLHKADSKAKSALYKAIALVSSGKSKIYFQQRLINYAHWDESAFFSNAKVKALKTPLVFKKNGFNLGIIAGFEAHFDEIWLGLKNANTDVVIMPCSNTFGSKKRWRALSQMRAFTNNMCVCRVNRVGIDSASGNKWDFYGDSLVAHANGEIIEHLDDKEGMLMLSLNLADIATIKAQWGFR